MQIEKNDFIIENIKDNILLKGKLSDPAWKNLLVLAELTKSLELLHFDSDIAKLHHLIIEKAVEARAFSTDPMPKEIEKLIGKLSKSERMKLNLIPVKSAVDSCLGMASSILGH